MNLLTLNAEHKQHLSRCTLLGVSTQKFLVIAEKYGATCKPDGVVYPGKLHLFLLDFKSL